MKVSIHLGLGLLVMGLLLGTGVGYSLTSEYKQNMYQKDDMGLGRADKYVDLRYINKMIAHHRGAMLLAEQLGANTQRQGMKDLSALILADEPKAIAELYNWKGEWYSDSKRVSDPQIANLGQYDDKFDLRFLNAIIAHHEEGIEMVEEIKQKSTRVEILNNADAVEKFLSDGLVTLKTLRKDWYNI